RADQLHVGRIRLVEQQEDVVRRDDGAAAGLAVAGRINALIVERDARVLHRVAVEEQSRRCGIDGDAAKAEGLEQLVDPPLLPEDRYLQDIERRRLRRPQVGGGEGGPGLDLTGPVMAELTGIYSLRRDRNCTGRNQ